MPTDTAQILADAQAEQARHRGRDRILLAFREALSQGFEPQGAADWKFRGADVDKITSDAVYLQTRLSLLTDESSRATLLASEINVPTDHGPQPLTIAQAIVAYADFGTWSRAIIERHDQRMRSIDTATRVQDVDSVQW